MLSDLAGSAVVLDQNSPDPAHSCNSDRLQPEIGSDPRFMKVSWNASETPPGYSSLGGDVIFVARPDGYERLTYPVQLNNEGSLSYGWQDTIFGEDLTLVVVLPPGHIVRAGDTRPVAAVSKVFHDRLAVCWQLHGTHQSRVWIHWKIRPAQPEHVGRLSAELNEELRHRHGSSARPSQWALSRKVWVGVALILAIGLAAGFLQHFVCGGIGGRHARAPFPHYERNQHKERVIVFVHGLFGNATSTWTCPEKTYWPSMLLKDHAFDDSDIYVASYDTPYVGNRMTIDDVVTNLDNRLENDHVFDHHDVVFVAHSLGGLIVQRFLLTHRQYARQVRLIYFFSTPDTGAQVAKIGSIFSQDPLLREMFPGDENDYLQNLEMEWRAADFGNIRRYCAYETKPTNGILVVDRLSGTRNCGKVVALSEDHFSIVKPCSADDDPYTVLRNAVLENPAPSAENAMWVWIDPISPPEFALVMNQTLVGIDSPLTAVEWDRLKAEQKQQLPAQWVAFGSPEYSAATAPARITLSDPASARLVAFVMNNKGGSWRQIEKSELGTAIECKKCASSSDTLRLLILVFPLDRASYDRITRIRNDPGQLFRTEVK